MSRPLRSRQSRWLRVARPLSRRWAKRSWRCTTSHAACRRPFNSPRALPTSGPPKVQSGLCGSSFPARAPAVEPPNARPIRSHECLLPREPRRVRSGSSSKRYPPTNCLACVLVSSHVTRAGGVDAASGPQPVALPAAAGAPTLGASWVGSRRGMSSSAIIETTQQPMM